MTRRLFGSLIGLTVSGLLLLAAALAVSSASAAARTEPGVKGGPTAPQAGPPGQPAGVWADIAAFPSITVSPTPGAAPARIKRAAAAAYFPNQKVYLFGGRNGIDGEDSSLRLIWEYTPGSPGSWAVKTSQLDSDPPGARFTANMAAVTLTDANGVRIYIIGGSSVDSVPTTTVRIYNPVADSLSTLTTDPWPTTAARVPGGWAVYSNTLYIFGGFSSLANGGAGGVFTDTWKFEPMSPAGQKWKPVPSATLNLGRSYIAGAALDGYIYAIGGDLWNPANPPSSRLVPVTNVERMDPSQPNPVWQNVAFLPSARGDMGAWAYDTGTGYEISGRIAVAGGHYDVPDAQGYLYNPGTNSWAIFPNLLHATRNYGVTQLNGLLYALGGYDYTNNLPDGANWNQRYDATVPTPTPTGTPPTNTPTSTLTRTPTATNTPCAVQTPLSEGFESGTLNTFASTVATCVPGGCGWSSVTTAAHTGTRSAFSPDVSNVADQRLTTNGAIAIPGTGLAGATLNFWHRYTFEGGGAAYYDGGVLEISTNGGTTWLDAGANITSGGYNGIINGSFANPLAGRAAWGQASTGYPAFTQVVVNLLPYAGQNLLFRFRQGDDNSQTSNGWWIDDIVVTFTVNSCASPTRTNTPAATITPTRTATPLPTTVLVGHVVWEGRPTPPNALNQLPISLTLQLGATVTHYPNRTTDASGFFTVPVTTLPNGVYTWWAKGTSWLATSGTVSLTGAPVTQQEMGLQPAGDVNNNNVVDITDFSLLRNTFGLLCGDTGFDGRADFTGDCLVDVGDFGLLRSHFAQTGPPEPAGPGVSR